MEKTQNKYLTILKLMGDCRSKLYATYNLFVTKLKEAKISRTELHELYEQLLVYRDEMAKASAGRIKSIQKDCEKINEKHHTVVNRISNAMQEPEVCRKAYKGDVKLCCDTYKTLKEEKTADINKGYRSQVKLIRAILDKIDKIKDKYNEFVADVKNESATISSVYNSIVDNKSLSV